MLKRDPPTYEEPPLHLDVWSSSTHLPVWHRSGSLRQLFPLFTAPCSSAPTSYDLLSKFFISTHALLPTPYLLFHQGRAHVPVPPLAPRPVGAEPPARRQGGGAGGGGGEAGGHPQGGG